MAGKKRNIKDNEDKKVKPQVGRPLIPMKPPYGPVILPDLPKPKKSRPSIPMKPKTPVISPRGVWNVLDSQYKGK